MKNADYPRPLLRRGEWTDLRGTWKFCFDDQSSGEKEKWYENDKPFTRSITVPFTYETKSSGIADETRHSVVWYSRKLEPDWKEIGKGNRMILIFEGADFLTKVWVNGQLAGTHKGGYARFSFDITDLLVKDNENNVTVRCEDRMDPSIPRGKQRWIKDNFACWYVETTGIWKTVWTEYVPAEHICAIKLTPDISNARIEAEIELSDEAIGKELSVKASFEGREISAQTVKVTDNKVFLTLSATDREYEWGIHTWSPDSPALYDLELSIGSDKVCSYFAMREVTIDNGRILLNGESIYQRLILDQGYWPESGLTPPSLEALEEDIDKCMQMGYNGARKHQKIEDERFLYLCDKKGYLIWSEMAATYEFNDDAVSEFTAEWMEIVRQNYSHPCIITWTPFNESWGVKHIRKEKKQQAFTEAIYHLTKAYDQMRPVIVNDGWEHTISDIITLHDYEENGDTLYERYTEFYEEIISSIIEHNCARQAFADGYSYHGQPIIISEFGGIAFNNGEAGWGYGNKVDSKEKFLERFEAITVAIKKLPYIQGYCYTQVTDVEQEINGLMTPNRKFKADPDKIREINLKRVTSARRI